MPPMSDHPQRYTLVNELHARPFPSVRAPSDVVFLALKQESGAAGRNQDADRAHLCALLDRFGVPHPPPGATHYSGVVGRNTLKWEQHSEFVTYTMFCPGNGEAAFDPSLFDVFPSDWLDQAPGVRVVSALLLVATKPDAESIRASLSDWFVPE
ncbi:MAG: DUF3422 family protein, partial [Paracoccaceae bacterium]